MEIIQIKATDNSPSVVLNHIDGFMEFTGKSYPENTFEFYKPLTTWIEEYFTSYEKEKTLVNIKLTYFNSATTQILFDILDAINDGKSHLVEIHWYYDSKNENGLDDYEDFSEEFESLKIQAVEY